MFLITFSSSFYTTFLSLSPDDHGSSEDPRVIVSWACVVTSHAVLGVAFLFSEKLLR